MSAGMPIDVPHGRRLVHQMCDDLGLQVSSENTGRPGRFTLDGHIDGVLTQAQVKVGSIMGAVSFSSETLCTIPTPLGLGLRIRWMQTGGVGRIDHVPEHWVEVATPVAWQTWPVDVTSDDPFRTRGVLAQLSNIFDLLNLRRLDDVGMAAYAGSMGTIGELSGHLRTAARVCRELVEAVAAFAPEEHPALPLAVWDAAVRRQQAGVDAARGLLQAELPGAVVGLRPKWTRNAIEKGGRYVLKGWLTWHEPLPFESLKITSQGGKSWLRRTLARDMKLGDEAFDHAFIVRADPQGQLEALFPGPVRGALLKLLGQVEKLELSREGALFDVGAPLAEAGEAAALLEACGEIAAAVEAARHVRAGAYR